MLTKKRNEQVDVFLSLFLRYNGKRDKNGQIFHSQYEVIDRPVNKSAVYSKIWRVNM